MHAMRLAAFLALIPAASSFAQVIDHSQARALIGQEVTINGPVAKVERLANGDFRVSIGRSFDQRSLEIIVPAQLDPLFGNGAQFEGRNVDVHGRILASADPAVPGIPAIVLSDARDLRLAPRRIVVTSPAPSTPSNTPAPPSRPADQRWAFTIAPGLPIGGPSGLMKDKLLADGWTERYCDFNRSTCHENPLVDSPRLALTWAVTRRMNRRIEAKAFFSYAGFGRAEGRRQGVDMRTDWSTFILGGMVLFAPTPLIRVGAGPVWAMLNSQRIDDQPRTVGRPGLVVETGVRSSATKSTFLDFSISYRMLPRRSEGPWPGRLKAEVVPAGPGTMLANFSHLSLSLGFGIRFSGNVE